MPLGLQKDMSRNKKLTNSRDVDKKRNRKQGPFKKGLNRGRPNQGLKGRG